MPEVRCHIAGVSHKNDNGSSRRQILKQIYVGRKVWLVAQPDNPRDSLAIAVVVPGVGQLGYLPAQMAREMAHESVSFPREGRIAQVLTRGTKPSGALIMFYSEGP